MYAIVLSHVCSLFTALQVSFPAAAPYQFALRNNRRLNRVIYARSSARKATPGPHLLFRVPCRTAYLFSALGHLAKRRVDSDREILFT